MTEAVATIKGQKLDARYTLLDKLGAGGQGEVWRAHDGTRGVDIALKLVRPGSGGADEAWRTLEHEYSIASRLDHSAILKVYPPERTGEVMILPMELAAGGDLRRLRGSGFLEIIPVLLELAQGLEHAHDRGVVHRDLKPSNVLFDIRGRARLADFGVAEQAMTPVEAANGAVAMPATRDTNRHGFSPFTASPAQLRGEPPTPADDIYGLGALAYELLSGYPPYYPHFDKKRAMEEAVPDLVPTRQIPPLLATLVMNMLAKDPKSRPRTMREVIDELDSSLNDTLTFDFESVSPTASSAVPERASAAEAEATGSRDAAGSKSESPFVWTPTSQERRRSTDRRGRRREDLVSPDGREPANSSDLGVDGPNATGARSNSTGSETRANATGATEQRGRRSSDDLNATVGFGVKPADSIDPNATIGFGQKPPSSGDLNATIAFDSKSSGSGSVDPNATIAFDSKRTKPIDLEETVAFSPEEMRQLRAMDPNATIAFNSGTVAPRGGNTATPSPGADKGAPRPRPTARSGADALARIDAALERAASGSSPWPKSGHPSITPEEAAALVAAARAATSRSKPAGAAPATPGRTVPWRSPATSTHLLPPEAPAASGQGAAARSPSPSSEGPSVQSLSAHAAATPVSGASAHPLTVEPFVPAPAAAIHTAAHPPSFHTGPIHASWDVPLDSLPKVKRLEPIRARRWPWVFLPLLAAAAVAVIFWLPGVDPKTLSPEVAAIVIPLKEALAPLTSPAPPGTPARASSSSTADTPVTRVSESEAARATPTEGAEPTTAAPVATSGEADSTANTDQRLKQLRQTFDTRLAALEARGAGVWGGREFASAKSRAAESVGAHDAGNARMAEERLVTALKLLDTVDSRAPQALSAQVAAGEKALGAGQQEVAGQAFDLARRISPADRRASDGQRRTQNLSAVLPLLADAQNAEAAHDYARAAQDYSQALFLDPGNATARAGQARANAAFGDDNYAKAVGSGFAALGAGRLDEAHEAFVKARALKPSGAEASEGLRRVSAALTARGFASMRQRAVGLEAQERWEEALRVYEDVLAADPSLAFAQEGKARTSSRADLSLRLQQLLDRPDRLSSSSVREDARDLLETARAQSPQGPVIRSQIARLEIALPNFDKPVRLSLVSDNSTQIAIPSIGSFGTFARRDIELRPGKYTVVGTRSGFRDVRREITIAPGQEIQTIRVTCSDPI